MVNDRRRKIRAPLQIIAAVVFISSTVKAQPASSSPLPINHSGIYELLSALMPGARGHFAQANAGHFVVVGDANDSLHELPRGAEGRAALDSFTAPHNKRHSEYERTTRYLRELPNSSGLADLRSGIASIFSFIAGAIVSLGIVYHFRRFIFPRSASWHYILTSSSSLSTPLSFQCCRCLTSSIGCAAFTVCPIQGHTTRSPTCKVAKITKPRRCSSFRIAMKTKEVTDVRLTKNWQL